MKLLTRLRELRNQGIETLACDFSNRLKGLENATKLRSLTISNYKSKNKNLLDLPVLTSLEHLNLIKPDINSYIY